MSNDFLYYCLVLCRMSIRMSPLSGDGEEVAGNAESGTPEVTETRSVVAPAQVKGELYVGIGKGEEAMVVGEDSNKTLIIYTYNMCL